MKTNRLIIAVTLIITGSFFVNISAQEALKAMAKKCENMENIDVSIVKNKDKKTKEPTQVVMTFRFTKNDALKKEILAAFEKDKDMAEQETVQKRDGLTNISYHFGNSFYSFRENKDGKMTFSANEYYTDNPIGRPLSFIDYGDDIQAFKLFEGQEFIKSQKDTLILQSPKIQILNNKLLRVR